MEIYFHRLTEGKCGLEEGGKQWIRFPSRPNDEVQLGRSSDHHVRLLSPHLSRNHASIKKSSDGKYYIKDLNSLNGIHVNDTRIEKETWQSLQENDKIEIGRPDDDEILKSMDTNDRFIYVAKAAPSEELNCKAPGPTVHMSASVKKMVTSKIPKKIFPNTKLKSSVSRLKEHPKVEEKRKICVNETNVIKDNVIINVTNHKLNSEVNRTEGANEMGRENKRLKLELQEKERALKNEIDLRTQKVEEEQKKIAAKMEKDFKNKLEQKEEELEIRLQLEKDLALEQCKAIVAEGKPSSTIETVVDTMDNELQCSICAELFIVSTILNCAHTFCEYCITEWRKVKSICPICRQEIETTTRSLVLDNYIDKVIGSLSGERKEIRQKLIEERKKMKEKQEKSVKTQSSKRGRGRGRGGAQRGHYSRGGATYTAGVRTRSAVVIISDDEESDTSGSSFLSDESDIDSFYEEDGFYSFDYM